MSTQKNEQYHILSSKWLIKNKLPEDAEFRSRSDADAEWDQSSGRGQLLDPEWDLIHYIYRTQRTDLPPEAYVTPPTDTTGSGREGETAEMDRFTYESFKQCKNDCDADEVWAHTNRIIVKAKELERQRDAALAQVEALRRDGEQSAEWSEILPEESGYWWHWSGHEDDAPFMHYIMWSGMAGKYFVSANTIPETPWVEDVGGYWIKATVPRAAIDSAQRQEGV